jgi:hypothetical protein
METIRQRSVLQAALLLTLSSHEEGLPVESVYDQIDLSYRFPDEWYRQIPETAGYEELQRQGIADWREVPQEQLIEMVPTEPQWKNEIRWSRNDLRKQGYLDTTAARGVWRLSAAGKQAALSGATEGLSKEERKIVNSRRKPIREGDSARRKVAQPGSGLRQELLSKLELLTHSMPLDSLQLLRDLARAVRKRSLPDVS